MANRTRKHSFILYLDDNEKYILDEKYKLSGMRSRMAFLRHLIVYGYVYDVDYRELHDYNTNLSRIGNSLNQIAKRMNATGHVYDEDVKEVKELMNQVWHVKATVHKAIAYICNPDKTDSCILISSYGCSPETAHYDFKFALSKTSARDENKAYHLIQSFLPGEVDFEEAHRIGNELADMVLEGRYSYVVSTHIDRDHVHNHIIFCAADNVEHHKYNDCRKSYYRIRQLSDELCKEHQLSVIVPAEQRGKKYNEWTADKNDNSHKSILRQDINSAVKISDTYEDFLLFMRAKGYGIKGEALGKNTPKYISFLPPGRERFIRGSVKSLGAEYTKEHIHARIEEKVHNRRKVPLKANPKNRLIDTSADRFQESAGLKRWAEIENLKTAANAYSKVNSITELEKKISRKSAAVKESRDSLASLERKIKKAAEIIKYAEQYQANRPYQIRYQNAKDPDNYFRNHESELILYDGAKEVLRRAGVNLKNLDVNKMRSALSTMEQQKKDLQQTYKTAGVEIKQMEDERKKLNQYLGAEQKTIAEQEMKRQGKNQEPLR